MLFRSEGDGSVPVYVQALLEQTAENMENLRHVLMRGEESRGRTDQSLQALNEQISLLAGALRGSQQVMQRLADSSAGGDDVARAHLRNIELSLQRIANEAAQGRTEGVADLRSDLKLLTRTVAALSGEPR